MDALILLGIYLLGIIAVVALLVFVVIINVITKMVADRITTKIERQEL